MDAVFTPIAARPAPKSTRGPVAWLRRNFFANWQSTAFTLVLLASSAALAQSARIQVEVLVFA